MFAQVWQYVVRGNYRSAAATVIDHGRFTVTDKTYPGMIELANAAVRGVVYFDVTAQDVAALDAFEGPDYRRDCIAASLDSGEILKVSTYIYLDQARLSARPWLPEQFQMQRFLATYCRPDAKSDAD